MAAPIETTLIGEAPALAIDRCGDGPPVVFLHGIGGNRKNWLDQLDALCHRYGAIAWDARGYGDSGDVDGERDFADFAADLARLLDALDIERAHLVGLSMGARILMTFFPRHRDRVATLTLCDCFPGFQRLDEQGRRDFLELREKPLLEGRTFADLAPALVDSLISPTATPTARAALHDSILKLRVEPYLKTLRATTTFDATADLADIDVPTQLIFGADDRLTPPAFGEQMLTEIPDARLAVITGAGHLSNIECPVEFNAVLTGFLDKHAARAAYRPD